MSSLIQMVPLRATLILSILCLFVNTSLAKVGNVTAQTRAAQITRKGDKILTEVDTPVEMRDLIQTLKGRTDIKFVDDTKVSVTEY